jgi:hypothetical protein
VTLRRPRSGQASLAGVVRLIRTGLHKDSRPAPYLAQRPRHSARAAARFFLKLARKQRLRSWLKWLWTEAWTAANFCKLRICLPVLPEELDLLGWQRLGCWSRRRSARSFSLKITFLRLLSIAGGMKGRLGPIPLTLPTKPIRGPLRINKWPLPHHRLRALLRPIQSAPP